MNKRQTHLAQTLQSMRSAQMRLQQVERMARALRADWAAGGTADPTGSLMKAVNRGREVQRDELTMAGRCLRTMYPASNDQHFEVAL